MAGCWRRLLLLGQNCLRCKFVLPVESTLQKDSTLQTHVLLEREYMSEYVRCAYHGGQYACIRKLHGQRVVGLGALTKLGV